MSRQEVLDTIRSKPEVTVLIIGGGINGIGVLRELAQEGVDVLLVEKLDFCAGASAASSHMVHGGLRYLENGEFRLVREALYERNLLLKNAPHHVYPLPTTVPIFRWFSGIFNAPLKFVRLLDRPGERGALVIKIGLMFYDLFARKHRSMPLHQFRRRTSALKKFPRMNAEIIAAATYYDAWMPAPERIGLELVLDAEEAAPHAKALNYVSVVGGGGDVVTLRDELSGETFDITPKVVVNAAGPWIDFANRAMSLKTQLVGGTKGSHLVLDNPELREAIGETGEIFFENDDGRIVLILAYLDRVMVGTTDIRIENPDDARCTDEETDYILGLIHKVFPTITVDRSQIVFKFSGVRPLPYSDSSLTGQISRDHSIHITEPGTNGANFPVFSLVGGKWTTFRAFAEQTVDKVLARLGRARTADTHQLPIGGGKGYPHQANEKHRWLETVAQETGIDPARLQTLFSRYGTRARDVAAFIMAGDDTPLSTVPDTSRREILFIAQHEKVTHLDDVLLRRTLIGMLGKTNGAVLAECAALTAEALGWTDAQRQAEIDRAKAILQDYFGVEPERLG